MTGTGSEMVSTPVTAHSVPTNIPANVCAHTHSTDCRLQLSYLPHHIRVLHSFVLKRARVPHSHTSLTHTFGTCAHSIILVE